MIRTPFDARAGLTQGRIEPSFGAPEGSFVLALGNATQHRVKVGDYVETYSTITATGKRVRLRASTTLAPDAAVGYAWRFTFGLVGGRTVDFVLDRDADFHDLALPWAGSGTVSLKLALEGAAGDTPTTTMPVVYLDSLTFDETDDLSLANRLPEPDQGNVPRATMVALELSTTASTITNSLTQVFVNGVLAYDNAGFKTGFDGPSSATSSLDAGATRRVVIDPVDLFESLEDVTVRVVGGTASGRALDTTYAFTCEDQTPAEFADVIARDESTVRVTWNEDVLQASPTGASDALNPEKWSVHPIDGFPAVTLSVVEVIPITSRSVDLITDIPMTPGAVYEVAASGVSDLFGNAEDGTWDEPGYWQDDDDNEEAWG